MCGVQLPLGVAELRAVEVELGVVPQSTTQNCPADPQLLVQVVERTKPLTNISFEEIAARVVQYKTLNEVTNSKKVFPSEKCMLET